LPRQPPPIRAVKAKEKKRLAGIRVENMDVTWDIYIRTKERSDDSRID
jgi:hypothetical protein